MRLFQILAGIAFFAAGAASSLAAVSSRVALRDRVDVQGSSISLADLLPAGAPAAMRASAQGILIGAAPEPGSARILDGAKIADLIGVASSRDIEIPRQIVVRRTGRQITREEVVAAIRAALKRNNLPGEDLGPDDLRVFPEVTASSSETALEVRRIDFDDTLNQAKFLMAERGALPFLVTAQLRGSDSVHTGAAETPASVPSVSGQSPQPGASAPGATTDIRAYFRRAAGAVGSTPQFSGQFSGAPLVEPGKAATLLLTSGTMQMVLDVTALDRGTLNQTVRVRVPGTVKILRAQVTGPRRLEAQF